MTRKNSRVSRATYRGRGDYSASVLAIKDPALRLEKKIDHLEKSLVKDLLSKNAAASSIGRTLGNFVNQGDLGALAGSSLAKYFGHGDYTVKSNSLMTGPAAHGGKFHQDGKRGTRIMEREYIGDIKSGDLLGGSTGFDVKDFNLNPTDRATFPWLSRIAPFYDQWSPNGMVFEFVSTSSEYNGTSQALGAVIMATDYDSYDPAFNTKQEMENADYACSTKPANSLVHGIECDPKERPTNILYTSTDNGAPLTSTSLGTFQVATQGCSTADVTLGELWISYDITFFKKQIAKIHSEAFWSSNGTAVTGGPYWPATTFNTTSNQITITPNIGAGSTINFNNIESGQRFLQIYYLGGSSAEDDTALAPINMVMANCLATQYKTVTVPGTARMFFRLFETYGPNATVTAGINATGNHSFQLGIMAVDATFSL